MTLKEATKRPWFWMIVFAILLITVALIYRISGYQADWAYTTLKVLAAIMGAFAVVGVLFAFVINPIRRLIEKRKEE